uniref:Ig-like domain-containing protein n=1 Tax=Myripristis murdjan TaxID=586833 RepID=A0A667WD44_9TELE
MVALSFNLTPVKKEELNVIATEGESLTLACTFETSNNKNAYLFWYKQEVNDFPKFMLQRGSYVPGNNAEEFPKEKFDAQINDTSVPLRIQKLQPSDSALYYCALKPTVTGNTQSLYKNLWRSLKTPMTTAMAFEGEEPSGNTRG